MAWTWICVVRRLSRVARREAKSGEPIPQPIAALRALGFVQLRGQLSLWVAAPGRGKSIHALWQALSSGVPTLYVSSDTDAHDQIIRAVTMLTMEEVSQARRNDVPWIMEQLALFPDNVTFEFDSNPTAEDLKEMVEAYRLVHGYYPWLLIMDTVGRVWSDSTDDESIMAREAVTRLQEIARHTGAHVMALHHATKMFDDGNTPIPLSGVLHGVSKIPEQICTMFGDENGNMAYCPVKNRSGKMDGSAMHLRAWVKFDLGRLQILELPGPIVVDIGRDILGG